MSIDLRNMTLEEMKEYAKTLGVPAFRGGQIFEWIYKGVREPREMKNLPGSLIALLEESAVIGTAKPLVVQKSKKDGTRKYLLELSDGNTIETVFMKYKFGNSICVSSQAGCRMGCKFCASTRNGLARNLTAGEMISQILTAMEDTGERISHIVIMGSGEPFDNYENVAKFIRLANEPKGLGIGMRNITVSTCGIVPQILKFGEDFDQVNLAISLHAPNNKIRSSMMPINNRYSIEEVVAECKKYVEMTHRRVTFEYTLVQGVNDGDEHSKELISLLRGMLCNVNLIPLNKVSETGLETAGRARAIEFQKLLENAGIVATVRRELGSDIDAACGQLRLNAKN